MASLPRYVRFFLDYWSFLRIFSGLTLLLGFILSMAMTKDIRRTDWAIVYTFFLQNIMPTYKVDTFIVDHFVKTNIVNFLFHYNGDRSFLLYQPFMNWIGFLLYYVANKEDVDMVEIYFLFLIFFASMVGSCALKLLLFRYAGGPVDALTQVQPKNDERKNDD